MRARPRWPAPRRERALDLLGTGPALAGEPDAAWVDAVRAEVTVLRRTARHHGAEAALRTGRPDTAADLAGAAAADDRFDEAAHRLLLRAHQQLGEPARALAVYRRAGRRPARRARRGTGTRDARGTPRDPARAAPGGGCRSGRSRWHGPPPRRPRRRGHVPATSSGATPSWPGSPAAWEAGEPRAPDGRPAGRRGRDRQDHAGGGDGRDRHGDGRPRAGQPLPRRRALAVPPAVRRGPRPGARPRSRRTPLRALAGPRAAALAELVPDLADALGGREPGRAARTPSSGARSRP